MSPKNVNEHQLTILRRIADGVEPVTSREHGLATIVYAFRDRGLGATMRTSGAWTASVTDEGRYFLARGHYRVDVAATVTERSKPIESDRRPPTISAEELIQRLADAGGSLHILDPRPAERASWRRAIHAAKGGAAFLR